MKLTPQIIEAQYRAGYRPPVENKLVCKNCGARKIPRENFKKYFCRRHCFYVHSMGYCPAFSTEEYVPPDAPKPSPFKQPELF